MSDRIIVRREERLGRITLAAGPLNVLGTDDVNELTTGLCSLRDCSVILIDAQGERAFSAGMEIGDHLPGRAHNMLEAVTDMAEAFESTQALTVAKVGAPALGGGFEIVLLCDFAVCSERARFSLPEISLAALPPIAAALLPAAVGTRRAVDMMITGRTIDAPTAEQWGVVNQAVSSGDLDVAALSLCQRLLSLSPAAAACCKRAIRAQNVRGAMRIYTEQLLPTHDAAEGIHAFLEKRKPSWSARRQLEFTR